ncbi:MAG TPA: urease accessory protein UreE [Opitutaceae bacterium]|nr:urease accessory protein UreE [Opitutaceae bacterium]
MHLVAAPLSNPRTDLPIVAIAVDRLRLAKRRWRGKAADGVEFGFELETPLKPDAFVWETEEAQYRIAQEPESLLEISLAITPSAAAGIGWAIGNLHLELSADADRLLTPDDPAARQLLERLRVPYNTVMGVFRPGRFVRGDAVNAAQELGSSHRH